MSLILPQASLEVITEDECQLWWAGQQMQKGKKLQDYVGKNEKTKLVIKIQKVVTILALVEICGICQDVANNIVESMSAFVQTGQGAPAREPLITDDQQKQMMLHYYRRQEELKVRKGWTNGWKNSKFIFHLPSVHLADIYLDVVFRNSRRQMMIPT